jgi:hypothetical protein
VVNQKLSNAQITSVCRELLTSHPGVTGSALRIELRRRFGSAGKKDRVYALWRSLRSEPIAGHEVPPDQAELEAQLNEARRQIAQLETALFDAEQRAARAEERERIHQDRWANEIYELRKQMRQLGVGGRGTERGG